MEDTFYHLELKSEEEGVEKRDNVGMQRRLRGDEARCQDSGSHIAYTLRFTQREPRPFELR